MSNPPQLSSPTPNREATIRLQAERHFSIETEEFETVEAYCLSLMHKRAYEEALRFAQNSRVLDLGCNNGYGTLALAASGAALSIGVDVSPRMLDEARQKRVHPRVAFMQVDGVRLPFANEAFDLTTSFQVIEHIADYVTYLSEIQRTLRPGGVALFTTPNAALRLDPGMRPWNMFHVREFRGDELHNLLKPWFREVQVFGLFAVDAFSSIERGRVSAQRERARAEQSRKLPQAWQIREQFIRLLKKTLPDPIVQSLRRAMQAREALKSPGSLPRKQGLATASLPAFTTKDLFYSQQAVENALDLFAVCRS